MTGSESEKGIFDAILEGEIDFESAPWPSISHSAKDLVRRMLTQDPKKRITSAQVLGIILPSYSCICDCFRTGEAKYCKAHFSTWIFNIFVWLLCCPITSLIEKPLCVD